MNSILQIQSSHFSPAVSYGICVKYIKKGSPNKDIANTSETVRLKNICITKTYQHLSCHCIGPIKSLAEMARFSSVP